MARDSEAVKEFLDISIARGHILGESGPDYVVVWDLPNGEWDWTTYFGMVAACLRAENLGPEVDAEVWERHPDTGWEPVKHPS